MVTTNRTYYCPSSLDAVQSIIDGFCLHTFESDSTKPATSMPRVALTYSSTSFGSAGSRERRVSGLATRACAITEIDRLSLPPTCSIALKLFLHKKTDVGTLWRESVPHRPLLESGLHRRPARRHEGAPTQICRRVRKRQGDQALLGRDPCVRRLPRAIGRISGGIFGVS